MGEARGAAMVAAASFGLDIFELAPRKVKLAIVGYGNAQKNCGCKNGSTHVETRGSATGRRRRCSCSGACFFTGKPTSHWHFAETDLNALNVE